MKENIINFCAGNVASWILRKNKSLWSDQQSQTKKYGFYKFTEWMKKRQFEVCLKEYIFKVKLSWKF